MNKKNKTLRGEFEKKFVERTLVKSYATKGWKKGVTANKVWKHIETKIMPQVIEKYLEKVMADNLGTIKGASAEVLLRDFGVKQTKHE